MEDHLIRTLRLRLLEARSKKLHRTGESLKVVLNLLSAAAEREAQTHAVSDLPVQKHSSNTTSKALLCTNSRFKV